ncbi:glycosyltransferase family 1 protein [Zasmidium cellare ATCC 36951]|uniref:Glycosyltransferase family 1 protein n=1 Tax=Zasmidium cellare ATCC 36951 TaxID=1080233 RepID=A0A6A6CN68_ZASCE|nr:glycosyltransferase family 1 protein [Zasmidium cellare ATCC 36951]KAF2168717.1 glycosyltransferase family 1 protein [Zasmidium cellare ATCC 36951]
MATKPPTSSIKRRPVPGSSTSQPQQPATAPAGPSRQDSSLEKTDLLSEGHEDDLPPPAYGEIYGEIRNDADGIGTSANVTDDGRVNIRINQLNRSLSQVFTPALRQQIQAIQDSEPPPPAYIPPFLGGDEKTPPPPPLNVVIQVVGSHGDVQPFVAFGKVLKNTYNHRVRLATHPNFKKFVEDNGLEFFNIGGDPSRLMAFMVKNPSLMPGFRSLVDGDVGQRRKDVAEYLQGCWRSCYEAGDGMYEDLDEEEEDDGPTGRPFVADCIIANPPSFAHIHCAEKMGIPLHIMFTMPYSATQAFPHPLANIQSSNADAQLTNFISYAMIELLSWQGLGDVINRFRKKCLGLNPVSKISAPGMLQRLKIPHTYCWSPALIPKPKDWGPHISIAGFYFLSSPDYTPAPELNAFLDAGPPPVYIGFGSIVLDDPDAMTKIIFEAAKTTGQRVLLSRGWGGIGAEDVPENVFLLGSVPHDWLFKHVSCVVHHGGAGTTSAGIAAGRPTVVVPFFGDQPFWGAMVARAGAGPPPIPSKKLTADRLADAINFCLKPESLERASELAAKIAEERGCDVGAQSFHQYLEPDRLRCTLAPSRAATWRIKHTKVKLSAFAASTLTNANLVDFSDLRLFRPQEHYTDEGPMDPISGLGQAALRAIGGMSLGLAEIPTETVKVFQQSSRPDRKQSQASVPTLPKSNDASSNAGEGSTRPLSPAQSRSSLRSRPSLSHLRNSSKLSVASSLESSPHSSVLPRQPSSVVGDSTLSQVSTQTRSTSNFDDTGRSLASTQTNSSTKSKNRDMMRHGAHKSKGIGRFAKSFFYSPMEMSVGITKGFHNAPKMWGDETVRPQERVTDMKSGMIAVGREFGLGWYDGVTGIVTQPWRGAQKEGTAGFFKGVGKGIGGFIVKPGAASMGMMSHTLKGIHKEVQKQTNSNMQSYIVASRAAQGYEEWLQSSDEEKEDVIERWKLIQKYMKKNKKHEEMRNDLLKQQGGKARTNGEARQSYHRTTSSVQSSPTADAHNLDMDSVMLGMGGTQPSVRPRGMSALDSREGAAVDGYFQQSNQEAPRRELGHNARSEQDANVEGTARATITPFQYQGQEEANGQVCEEDLRRPTAKDGAAAQQPLTEKDNYESQLNRAMSQSMWRQGQESSSSEIGSVLGLDDSEDEEFERSVAETSTNAPEKITVVASGSSTPGQPPTYDPGHLAGVTQSEFEAQRSKGKGGEKTAQEKTEEEIVMEYIKKQSLLEAEHHQTRKGKGRATAAEEDEEDEELQMVLKLSMQEAGLQNGDVPKS